MAFGTILMVPIGQKNPLWQDSTGFRPMTVRWKGNHCSGSRHGIRNAILRPVGTASAGPPTAAAAAWRIVATVWSETPEANAVREDSRLQSFDERCWIEHNADPG